MLNDSFVRFFSFLSPLAAGAVAMGGISASSAQAPASSRAVIEEIVVTAQRREQAITDVPISIQAYTGDTLKRLGIVDTSDLASLIPGFSYANSGQDNPIYTMRGVGFDDPSRLANSSVGVYIDEAPITYSYMTQGADVDLERVEVLKGPQGTLYGRNTTGGAINYITKKPTTDFEFGLEAEYEARFESTNIEVFLSGPLSESISGRLAWRGIESDEGWQKSLTRPGDRLGEKDKQAARGMIEWVPVDPVRFNFSVDWWRDTSDPQAAQPIDVIPQNRNLTRESIHPAVANHPTAQSDDAQLADWPTTRDWTLNNEMLMPALRAYWDFTDNMTAALIANYIDFKTEDAKLPQSGLSVENFEVVRSTDASAYSIELRLSGNHFDERLSWLVGVITSENSVEDTKLLLTDTNSAVFNVVPGVFPISTSSVNEGKQETESQAIFANTDFSIIESLTLTLGARYTNDDRTYEGCSRDEPSEDDGIVGLTAVLNSVSASQGGSGDAQPGECFSLDENTRDPVLFQSELEEDSFGGKAALTWTPNPDHLFYVSFSRAFKAGSFPIIPASEAKQLEPATQEQVDAIELGGKTSWLEDSLKVNFAIFDYDYADKQVFSFIIDPVFGPLPKLFNAPKSKVRGAELEIQSSPLPGLFISAAASYLKTEIKEFTGITTGGQEADFSGNELPYAPSKEVSLLANYSFPLPFIDNIEGNVSINYSYVGDASSEIEKNPLFDIASYELVNARIGISGGDGRWNVGTWARNATDEFYQLNVPQFAGDTRVRYVGMPRTYGVTFSYHYF